MPATAYDIVEYPGGTFVQTHPSRLAAIARLHGVPAASPAKCRVLELGAADGNNLLPLALRYPESEFLGIDLAETIVAKGMATRDALGIKNLTLLAADLCDLPDSIGTFDYILAHGVFSWVPDPIRDGLLELCKRVLAPYGVAYISYNAQPGGHLSQMVDEMMRYHIRRMPDPDDQLQQSRALMRMIHDGTNIPSPLGDVLKTETRRVFQEFGDALLFHDDLSSQNRRYYFHEFAELADRHDLQFLAEADYKDMSNAAFPPGTADMLEKLGRADRVQEEQYRDFLCLRRFRQTLLVRSDVAVTVPARAAELAGFHVSANPMKPVTTLPDLSPGVQVRFESMKGSLVTLDHPLSKAALLELVGKSQISVAVPELLRAAAGRLGLDPDTVDEENKTAVLSMLFQCFSVGIVHLTVDPPAFAATPGPRPKLSRLARHQLDAGRREITLLSTTASSGSETPLTRQLVLACDGTRDRADILEHLLNWAVEQPPRAGQPVETREQLKTRLGGELEAGLQTAADLALLEA